MRMKVILLASLPFFAASCADKQERIAEPPNGRKDSAGAIEAGIVDPKRVTPFGLEYEGPTLYLDGGDVSSLFGSGDTVNGVPVVRGPSVLLSESGDETLAAVGATQWQQTEEALRARIVFYTKLSAQFVVQHYERLSITRDGQEHDRAATLEPGHYVFDVEIQLP